MATKKVVINVCFGGFGLSDAAYEKLIEWGVPVREYVYHERDPLNDGEIIFDNELTPATQDSMSALYHEYKGSGAIQRYWDGWTPNNREHPLIIRVVEELGHAANGRCADLKIVEIPADVEYEIAEYDGNEHIAEAHRTWD